MILTKTSSFNTYKCTAQDSMYFSRCVTCRIPSRSKWFYCIDEVLHLQNTTSSDSLRMKDGYSSQEKTYPIRQRHCIERHHEINFDSLMSDIPSILRETRSRISTKYPRSHPLSQVIPKRNPVWRVTHPSISTSQLHGICSHSHVSAWTSSVRYFLPIHSQISRHPTKNYRDPHRARYVERISAKHSVSSSHRVSCKLHVPSYHAICNTRPTTRTIARSPPDTSPSRLIDDNKSNWTTLWSATLQHTHLYDLRRVYALSKRSLQILLDIWRIMHDDHVMTRGKVSYTGDTNSKNHGRLLHLRRWQKWKSVPVEIRTIKNRNRHIRKI